MQSFYKIFCLGALLFVLSCKQDKSLDKREFIESPLSITGLQNRSYTAELNLEKELIGTETFSAELMSYYSDSLKVYTLVHTPKTKQDKNGFPVLIFAHGFHPEPEKYGVSTVTGEDWRPGDYYRGIPESYAENGFLTLTPDYRGHNISEGFDFTKSSYLASTYYAIDVLHLINAVSALKEADKNKIFLMGHSMGGDVTLKVLLVNDNIKAASLWSAVTASTVEQAMYYGKWDDESWDSLSPRSMKNYLGRLDSTINNLGFEYNLSSGDPIQFLDEIDSPIIIHHATNETSVPYQWSESLAAKLYEKEKSFTFYSYESKNHLFRDENKKKALERDISFFKSLK